jgi:hypothetical protein
MPGPARDPTATPAQPRTSRSEVTEPTSGPLGSRRACPSSRHERLFPARHRISPRPHAPAAPVVRRPGAGRWTPSPRTRSPGPRRLVRSSRPPRTLQLQHAHGDQHLEPRDYRFTFTVASTPILLSYVDADQADATVNETTATTAASAAELATARVSPIGRATMPQAATTTATTVMTVPTSLHAPSTLVAASRCPGSPGPCAIRLPGGHRQHHLHRHQRRRMGEVSTTPASSSRTATER